MSTKRKIEMVSYDRSTVSAERICQRLLEVGYEANLKTKDKSTSADISGKPPENLDDLICYCFGYSVDDIEQDFIKNGRSTINAKIAAEKKAGGCDCVNKNPKGR